MPSAEMPIKRLVPIAVAPADPLPSWRPGPVRAAIEDYLARVTRPGPDFVDEADRIAVFDNDGTLWPEQPMPFQAAFALDELAGHVAADSALAADPMVQAALRGEAAALMAGPHHDGLLTVLALTHAGMTTDSFAARVNVWMASARHSGLHRRYCDLAYAPMQEMLAHFRANGFRTYIVSGGGADFMRVFAERIYGIAPEQVIGSQARARFEWQDGAPVMVKTLEHLFVDDKEGKPSGIHAFIGRRPIAAFGNSDGDKAMLEYVTVGNPRPSLGVIIHHTDSAREFAYDREAGLSGKLVDALVDAPARGWTVVDMARDWLQVFAPTP
jgi:phosphoglycolate phosphatase-like HAD superfamily hydrolase